MKNNFKLFIAILTIICIMPLISTNVNATSDTITLISGNEFSIALNEVGKNATKVKFTKEAIPAEKISGAKLVSESGAKEAYMYLDGDTIYVSPKEANAVIYASYWSSGMFSGCSKLTSIDLNNFNTSKVINMSFMFDGCSGLTSLDLSKFDTSKVTNMGCMFDGCSGLTSLDLSKFDTSNVTSMCDMFDGCSGLTSLDLSNFDTSKVTNMGYMFERCSGLASLNLSNFNTSNVTDMTKMFYVCSSLTSLDVSNFDTSNVTSMIQMFFECSGLASLDLSNFNTSKVTDMANMFYGCSGLTSLDVSKFDVSKVTDVDNMFGATNKLVTINNYTDIGWASLSTTKDTKLSIHNGFKNYKNHYFKSSDENIAKIDDYGNVTIVGEGTAFLTYSVEIFDNIYYSEGCFIYTSKKASKPKPEEQKPTVSNPSGTKPEEQKPTVSNPSGTKPEEQKPTVSNPIIQEPEKPEVEIKVTEDTNITTGKIEDTKKETLPKTGGAISNNILIIMLVSFVSIAGFVTSKVVLKKVKNTK